ncbi:MAG: hypothetical protein HEEMFOPI_01666 [Holosporales bacterium]
MGIAALTAGIASKVVGALNISPDLLKADIADPNIFQSIAIHTPEAITRGIVAAVTASAFNEPVGDSLLEGVAANAIGAGVANCIGQFYAVDKLNFVTHKIAHGLLGAATGAMISGEKGALSGAIAAMAAEITADILSPEKPNLEKIREQEKALGRDLTETEFNALYTPMYKDYTESDVENTKKIGKIVGVTLGTLIGQDLNVSQLISANAIDNNYAHLAIWGVAAAGTAYSAYQVYKAYESGGATAALKTLGIEVGMVVVGGAFVKGAMAGGKLAFRFIGDTKTYATVAEILSVAYEGTPGLKHCVKSIHNKIIQAFERFEGSAVGQTLVEWDAKLAGRSANAAVAEAEVVTSTESKKFIPQGWNRAEEFTFNGRTNKVYQRDDLIDLNRVDARTGKTSKELMQNGFAPIGPDGKPINLHHTIQAMDGPLLEITQEMHKANHGLLHIWPNKAAQQHGSVNGTLRREVLPEINRPEFDAWKKQYWRDRLVSIESAL